jgi:hypothetical protein
MASKRQNEANRENAKRSTGPKTDAGRAKSSRNARRHGLSRPIQFNEGDFSSLANVLAGGNSSTLPCVDLTAILRAKLQLNRVRVARHELLARLLKEPDPKLAKRLQGLERYERVAFAKQKRATKANDG